VRSGGPAHPGGRRQRPRERRGGASTAASLGVGSHGDTPRSSTPAQELLAAARHARRCGRSLGSLRPRHGRPTAPGAGGGGAGGSEVEVAAVLRAAEAQQEHGQSQGHYCGGAGFAVRPHPTTAAGTSSQLGLLLNGEGGNEVDCLVNEPGGKFTEATVVHSNDDGISRHRLAPFNAYYLK